MLVDKELRERAFGHAEKTMAGFCIDVLHESDGIRRWRCWDGSSTYAFEASEFGNCITVIGDMGDWVWVRCNHMLSWLARSWQSDSYFDEKLVACNERDRCEFWPEAVAAWFREQRTYYGDDISMTEELDEMEESWAIHDPQCEFEFYRMLSESDHFGCDGDLPSVSRYTYRFHWIQRALSILAERVSSGAVVYDKNDYDADTCLSSLSNAEINMRAAQLIGYPVLGPLDDAIYSRHLRLDVLGNLWMCDSGIYQHVWSPCDRIADTWSLVEDAKRHGMWLKLQTPFAPGRPSCAGFTPHGISGWNGRPDHRSSAIKEARAISEAYIIWKEGRENESARDS
jgi:hypothetical protein